jgi:hypothetical protein
MSLMTIQKNNPYSAPITITKSDGSAYDLTGKTVFFTLKRINDYGNDDTDALITLDILPASHTDAINGITTLSLSAAQTNIRTGEYKCDIRIYQAGVVQANSETFTANVVDIVTKRNA